MKDRLLQGRSTYQEEWFEEPAGKDPYYWNRVVHRMRQRWEAPLEEQDEETVVQYLNSHFTRK